MLHRTFVSTSLLLAICGMVSCASTDDSRTEARPAAQPEVIVERDAEVERGTAQAQPRHSLSIHVASTSRSDSNSIERTGPGGQVLFLNPEPLLTRAHFERADSLPGYRGTRGFELILNADGAAIANDHADHYTGKIIALVWNDRVVFAPVAKGSLGERFMVLGGTEALPVQTLEAIKASLNMG